VSRWYRAYAGTVTDAKLAEAALIANVSRSVSIAAWHCLLESAAERNNCGSYETSARRVAVILCEPPSSIETLLQAFDELGLIGDGAVKAWSKRQFQSDGSAERVKRYRENRKAQGLAPQWQPTKELRQKIYDRDGNACVYCGSDDDLTIDHKTPEMHGGDHSSDNLQTACRRCNAQKRDLTHKEYVARLAGNGGVTLPKRPHKQRTEANTETEERSPSGDSSSGDEPPLAIEEVFQGYQKLASDLGLSVPRDLTPERRQIIRFRTKQYPLDDFRTVFAKCRDSPFLRGDKGRTPLTFDWIFKKGNFQKTLEGNYD
jgi:5-methylcytosine-specific restriction endonuclease McrA